VCCLAWGDTAARMREARQSHLRPRDGPSAPAEQLGFTLYTLFVRGRHWGLIRVLLLGFYYKGLIIRVLL
jgi:hypothetical protein